MMVKNVRLDKVLEILRQDPCYEVLSSGTLDLNSTYFAGIASNSNHISRGFIFVALHGSAQNGEDYIPAAIKQGATTIIARPEACQDVVSEFHGVRFICLENPRKYVGPLAALFYPEIPTHMVAVTGTNGKTSVVEFCRQFWEGLGEKSASIGTLGINTGKGNHRAHLTTMDPIELRRELQVLSRNKITHVALEASSHGLDQHRLAGLKFEAAGFTNLTQDHLDYHKNFKAYFQAKSLLFEAHLKEDGIAVLNADLPEYNQLDQVCLPYQTFSYGKGGKTFNLKYIESQGLGQRVSVDILDIHYQFFVPFVGRFQVFNILCAMGLILSSYPYERHHECVEKMVEMIPSLNPVPGRMEEVSTYNGGAIYVDFAHTPHALRVALEALRQNAKGQIMVIFGCGGNRDAQKRPIMGEIAHTYADRVIVTDDNPRYEQPAFIRRAIMRACPKAEEMGDRSQAILYGIQQLAPGDVLLIAGKGHEEGQSIAGHLHPFNDREVVVKIISELKHDALD